MRETLAATLRAAAAGLQAGRSAPLNLAVPRLAVLAPQERAAPVPLALQAPQPQFPWAPQAVPAVLVVEIQAAGEGEVAPVQSAPRALCERSITT